MDPTENLSARVLLKHILNTEPPRTPVTRSLSKEQSTSATRRSSRLANKDSGAQTPQDILRRSLKHKLRESITRKSLPAPKRRTASIVLKKTNTPGPASMLFDEGDTPRHILRNILLTEPVRSPVVHEKAASEEPQLPSANSNITSKRPSIELSALDLPDLTISNAVSTTKGLSRKRPHRSFNVTAFEKRLKDGEGVEEENEESIDDHSSLSLSSSTSLSLKTPFADVQTVKGGLQRRVSNRRKITEEEFGAAVDKRQIGGATSFVAQGLSETAYSEGFTLGLSKLSEPDITTDVIHCNTALYAQPDAMTSDFSIVATQDKPTVMASQLQRQMTEVEEMDVEQNRPKKERSMYLFPTEEGISLAMSEDEEDAVESKKEEGGSTADGSPEDAEALSKSEEEEGKPESPTSVTDETPESEEEENKVEAGTEEGAADSQKEEEGGAVDSQTEEDKEDGGVDSQPEEDVAAFQSEEEEVASDPQTEEEEDGAVESQTKELDAADSQTEEEEEEDVTESQSDREDPVESGLADSQPYEEDDGKPKEQDDEQASEQLERDVEHISRRAHRSEGGVMPLTEAREDLEDATEAGWSDGKSKAYRTIDLHSSLEMESHESGQHHIGVPDLAESSPQGQRKASHTEAEPDEDKEKSFHLSVEESGHLSEGLPEHAAAQGTAEQEEEWEDEDDGEESEEVPSKTPAFVREKRNFFHPDPLASPSVHKNVQARSAGEEGLTAPKPKLMKKRAGPTKKEAGLPKSYLMSTFKHFAKTKVSADVYPVLKGTMDKFFERLADDLETYAVHARRKTIEVEDAELLLRRQGHVNDKVPVEVLIEKYLRMDQRKLLIPIATSGNVVIPKRRR